MSLGRRKIRLEDPAAWVFNKMAADYPARPPYPPALVEALAARFAACGRRVGDLGAGIGHLALPLAARGFEVTAVEPAHAMLEGLRQAAAARHLPVRSLHATAEALPLERGSLDAVVVADAVHFLDRELAAAEIARVLAPRGALAVITCAFADTPFMRAVAALMEASAPRRPRALDQVVTQLGAVAGVAFETSTFEDQTPVDAGTLERLVRSISFIGPAMNAERFARFRQRLQALSPAPVWARTITLHAGRR